ncbi:carboxyltransferase domain-containing protein [bacterium]|nr:carboxyltransferase domain-containing protein [bacterium]
MKHEITAMKIQWLSERELSVLMPPDALTPGLRRKISQSDGPSGSIVTQGARAVHFLWDPRTQTLLKDPTSLQRKTEAWIETLLVDSRQKIEAETNASSKFTVPVRYGHDPLMTHDLERLARLNRCTAEEIVRRHRATTWFVAFSGFQPGFAYLEPMPGSPAIDAPRHETPRAKVPAGSVALGGSYCGIYPQQGPGGWNLIGETSLSFLDPASGAGIWQTGDLVEFV